MHVRGWGAPYLQSADQHRRVRRRADDRADEMLDNVDERGDRREIERERVTDNQWLLGAAVRARERDDVYK